MSCLKKNNLQHTKLEKIVKNNTRNTAIIACKALAYSNFTAKLIANAFILYLHAIVIMTI